MGNATMGAPKANDPAKGTSDNPNIKGHNGDDQQEESALWMALRLYPWTIGIVSLVTVFGCCVLVPLIDQASKRSN